MLKPVIQARSLRKSFNGREVIRGVDFDVPPGVCFGILGPNGAGKTTLIRMLLGLSPVSGGNYRLFDRQVGDPGLRQRIGVVFQDNNLDPDFTVRENLLVYASYYGIGKAEAARRLPPLLKFAALTEREHSKVSALSGGMCRRLMLARALINEPDLIVLDEPTTGLDPQARHLIWQRLRQLRAQGKTLVLTTHYMEEAEQLCDTLMILDAGRVLEQGAPRELVKRHIETEVVEIRGDSEAPPVDALGAGLDVRIEQVGGDFFCYMDDAEPLLARCRGIENLHYLHRPSNLEDVFLKLTGRELRE